MVQQFTLPVQQRQVEILFITRDGKTFTSKKEYDKHPASFMWVDRQVVIGLMQQLKPLTESWKKSQIVIYEKEQSIQYYINVPRSFQPLPEG